MLDRVFAVEHGADFGFDLIGRNVGEKPEAAAVHADHRHLRRREIARNAEQAAVAADDDQQIARWRRAPCALRPGARISAASRRSPIRTTIETLRARRNCSSVATDSTMLRLPLRAISPTVLKVMRCLRCGDDDRPSIHADPARRSSRAIVRRGGANLAPLACLNIWGASAQACPPTNRRRAWAAHWKTAISKC